MPSNGVRADHERKRAGRVALEFLELRLVLESQARAIAVTAVEDFTLEDRDRLVQLMDLDVGNEFIELGTIEQREGIGEQMERKGVLRASGFFW
jgi:hypothetical protein